MIIRFGSFGLIGALRPVVVHKDIPIPVMHRITPFGAQFGPASLWIEMGIGSEDSARGASSGPNASPMTWAELDR